MKPKRIYQRTSLDKLVQLAIAISQKENYIISNLTMGKLYIERKFMEQLLLILAMPLVFVFVLAYIFPNSKDHITAINKLRELYNSGIISKQEFEKGVNKRINSRCPDDCSLFGAEGVLEGYKALREDRVITRTQYEKRAKRLIKKIRNNAKL